ncbi:MAG TPA: PEGA domain-containing protein [Candidatus Solibacter sp.]|nr:PEGA domain-containing protein [Candidatus Solibacter sp.]
MKKRFVLLFLSFFAYLVLAGFCFAQNEPAQNSPAPQQGAQTPANPAPANAAPSASQAPAPASTPTSAPKPDESSGSANYTSAKGFVLEDGTPVKMRINRTVSSADAHVGDTIDFEVLQDISVNGTLVIPKGGLAFATVTEAQAKRRMARGGKLDINIDYVKLISSEKAALRAVKDMKGGGHTGAMVGGMVATSLVFFPAAPFFLFMHGKDISIPKGTEVTAYINGDMKLDIAKFQPAAPTQTVAAAASATNSTSAKLQLESNPAGADIEVDGSFVGNTPSDVLVEEGDHTITVKKSGFKDWERKMKVSAGSSVHLSAELEKVEAPTQ